MVFQLIKVVGSIAFDNFTKADAFKFVKKKIKKNYPNSSFIDLVIVIMIRNC